MGTITPAIPTGSPVSKFFTFDLVLGIYVALSVACGLYLFNVYRLPHDHEAPESIGVPRLDDVGMPLVKIRKPGRRSRR